MYNNDIKQKTLVKLFPFINNKNKIEQLKIDDASLHYISIRDVASTITSIIILHLRNIKVDFLDIIITDTTAGVGGNTLSFSNKFKFVNSIEINKKRFDFLKNNINVYDVKNIKLFNDNCLKIINNIEQDVVFIDPPWGGSDYKFKNKLHLYISKTKIEDICNNLMDKDITKYPPKLIVLKIPKNYDLFYLYNNIKSSKIYLYKLKKMFIIVIINSLI